MANEQLIKQGAPLTWAAAGGDYALTLTSLANNAGRQGAKGDLGAARAAEYAVQLQIGSNTAPSAGEVIELYWYGSPSATAGSGNPAGIDGSDAAFAAGQVDEWKRQLDLIGVLVVTNDAATIMRQHLRFRPPYRYGGPVVVNKSGQALSATAGDHQVVLTPIVDEAQ